MKTWENFLTIQDIELGKETVNKWLRPLKIVRFDAGNLYLEAKDSFQILWFEEHIRPKIKTRFLSGNNKPIKVHLTVEHSAKVGPTQNSTTPAPAPPFKMNFDVVNPYCKFENFIVTEGNELAFKVLAECAGYRHENKSYDKEFPLEPYFNPIYIFGDKGTGKTHLLMATAAGLRRRGLNVLYVRSETFTEHVVTAIRAGEMSRFRQAYRNVDALLIDNVHGFSRKGATQEELFHTFNTLHLLRKPIIMAADCAPNELKHVEPRLVSRFEWGIAPELKPYTKSEITKIIVLKSEFLKFNLRPAIADFLTETFQDTILGTRALEALILRSHLNNKTPHFSATTLTVPIVKNTLKDLIAEKEQKALTSQKIIKSIAEHYGITTEDILGKSQTRDCALPRKLAMFIIREKLNISFVKIGDIFLRDHSTVISSVNGIQKMLPDESNEVGAAYRTIQKKLKES